MTLQEIRDSIRNMVERDDELERVHIYLDRALGMPINEVFQLMVLIDEMKKRMKEDVVHFTFRKKDGTIRSAYGTRVGEIIVRHEGTVLPPEEKRPGHSAGTFPYFDIERSAWRCFKLESLMDINRGYTI